MFSILIDNLFAKYTSDGNMFGDSSLILMIIRAMEEYGPGDGDKFFYLQSYFTKKYPHAIILVKKDKSDIGSADRIY